jgi:hypothetical protein
MGLLNVNTSLLMYLFPAIVCIEEGIGSSEDQYKVHELQTDACPITGSGTY